MDWDSTFALIRDYPHPTARDCLFIEFGDEMRNTSSEQSSILHAFNEEHASCRIHLPMQLAQLLRGNTATSEIENKAPKHLKR